jgi:hypothetical protein
VKITLSSLAGEISDPKGRRLNALSIPTDDLVGEAAEIRVYMLVEMDPKGHLLEVK